MKSWFIQLAGALLVLAFALTVGGFVMVLRAQQSGLAATMAAANIRAVSPADGAVNVPISGQIRADYISRPIQDPTITFEPPVGVTLDNAQWDGTTFVLHYTGLRENSLYHVELDQDTWTGKGEHKQVKVRWSFRTGSGTTATPTARPTASASPSTSPSASPSNSPGSQAPLIWYRGPSSDLHGLDWTGKEVKHLSPDTVMQSPDGQLLWRRPISPTSSSVVTNSDGNPVGAVVSLDESMMWADDSRQFCGLKKESTGSYALEMLRINGTSDRVGVVPLTPGTAQFPVLAACSVLARRAVVLGETSGYVWSVTMISLSDGSVLYQQRYPNPLTRIVASHDGQYIVEQYGSNANGGPAVLIRQLPSGTTVGQFSGLIVQGFSWDGSLVAGGIQGNSGLTGAEIIRWQDRHVIWNQCSCPSPFTVRVIAQPDGNKLAIGAYNQQGVGTLTIVDSNGAAIAVPVGNGPFLPLF